MSCIGGPTVCMGGVGACSSGTPSHFEQSRSFMPVLRKAQTVFGPVQTSTSNKQLKETQEEESPLNERSIPNLPTKIAH